MHQRVCFLLILLVGCYIPSSAEDRPFPKLQDLAQDGFETKIELVNSKSLNMTLFATEIYDFKEQKGHVEMIEIGEKISIYYSQKTGQISYVNSTSCSVDYVNTSPIYMEKNVFGWVNEEPLEIGPTALLRRAEKDKTEYKGQKIIRYINCNMFTLTVLDRIYNVSVDYYFSDDQWTTPFKKKSAVPVRIEVKGDFKDYTGLDELSYVMDFIYFRPSINDPSRLEPPVGLGCHNRDTDDSQKMPAMPKQFKFYAEAFNLKKAKSTSDTEVDFEVVWYHQSKGMARIDSYSLETSVSMLFDFRTGVTYRIADKRECEVSPLRDSVFEKYDDDSEVGQMKEPEEILGIVGDFYYMGKREMRGIKCKVFESAKVDYYYRFAGTRFAMFVTTVYFALDDTKEAIEGVDVLNPPVFVLLTGYETANEESYKMQYNIYAFTDAIDDSIYATFNLETCFPLSEQKSYFVIADPSDPDTAKKMEGKDTLVVQMARKSIIKTANITEIRLPFLKVDYLPAGIYFTGLMLDKPRAMDQFYAEFHGISITNKILQIAVDADTEEACATACIEMTVDTCRRFHFCGKSCWLNSHKITDVTIDDGRINLGECTVYMRAESDSKNIQDSLPKALKNLETAINNGTFGISVPIDNDDYMLKPTLISITDGPFNKETNDYPYTLIFNGRQIMSEQESETTLEVPDADTENDCYRRCKDETSITCTSFSYCFKASNKMCRLSSVLMDGRTKNYEETTSNSDCNTFSMMYLDSYEKFPGKIVLVPGDKQVTQIESLEECAHTCKNEKNFNCRGFEYCRIQKTCVLHSKHILDLKSGETATASAKCVHYAAKFSADYIDMGHLLIDDESNEKTEITLEQCARLCSEEVVNCKSFNYCPPSSVGTTDSKCSLTSRTLVDNVNTKTSDKCHMYTKRNAVDDWGKSNNPVSEMKGSGYTSGGLAGVIIGTLVFGLVVGALIFFAYSYYRSRHGADGMTVKFSKADNI